MGKFWVQFISGKRKTEKSLGRKEKEGEIEKRSDQQKHKLTN
jgi:hypothetical protein